MAFLLYLVVYCLKSCHIHCVTRACWCISIGSADELGRRNACRLTLLSGLLWSSDGQWHRGESVRISRGRREQHGLPLRWCAHYTRHKNTTHRGSTAFQTSFVLKSMWCLSLNASVRNYIAGVFNHFTVTTRGVTIKWQIFGCLNYIPKLLKHQSVTFLKPDFRTNLWFSK